jgi:hypothetical protein
MIAEASNVCSRLPAVRSAAVAGVALMRIKSCVGKLPCDLGRRHCRLISVPLRIYSIGSTAKLAGASPACWRCHIVR